MIGARVPGYGRRGAGWEADDEREEDAKGGNGGGGPTIQWEEGTVDLEMMGGQGFGDGADGGGGGGGGALEEAKGWLMSLLSVGPVPAAEVRRRAIEEGIAFRMVQKAKGELGVPSVREGGSDGCWVWRLDQRMHGAV